MTALLKATGNVAAPANRYPHHDLFGSDATATETVPNTLALLRYARRECDVKTQLYYNQARYYDPAGPANLRRPTEGCATTGRKPL